MIIVNNVIMTTMMIVTHAGGLIMIPEC